MHVNKYSLLSALSGAIGGKSAVDAAQIGVED